MRRAALVLALVLAASAAGAQTRTETLRWTQADPERVTAWRAVAWGHTGAWVATFELGKPSPDAAGVYSSAIEVQATHLLWIRLVALGAGGSSGYSNARLLLPPEPVYAPAPGEASPPAEPAQDPAP